MADRTKRIIIVFFITFSLFEWNLYAKTETVSGKIYEVYPSDNEFTVSTAKPEGDSLRIIGIQVNDATEYHGITNLGDLRLDQDVEVVYAQVAKGPYMAQLITAASVEIPKQKESKKSL